MNGKILTKCLVVMSAMTFSLSALADDHAGSHEGSVEKEEKWAKLTIQPGLQMWQPLYYSNGNIAMKPTIGLVTKVHYALTDMFGIHVRGTYGLNQVEIEGVQNENYSAYAAGLGADFFIALGDKAMWYNTMGVGFGQSTASTETTGANAVKGPENTLTTVGAYFVTGFDVKVFGNMGVWMDWGCQVVGPTFGEVKMASDTAAIKVSTFHINPVGAGGMRISF